MRNQLRLFTGCLSAALLLAASSLRADVTVGVNPGSPWIGFMNVFNLPADGGAFVFNGPWGTADLDASFSGPVLTLTPNTSISRDVPLTDAFWWKPSGEGNKNMDANFYVQDDTLAGQTVTFSGTVLANSLVSPYTSTIFIKDFDAGFSLIGSMTVPVTPGAFSISLATIPGTHVQYGFETLGPNARLDEVTGFGLAQIAAVPEPSTVALLIGGILCGAMGARRKSNPQLRQ